MNIKPIFQQIADLEEELFEFQQQLRKTLKDGNVLILTNEKYRQAGVSTIIKRYAKEQDLPIVLSSYDFYEYYQNQTEVECYRLVQLDTLRGTNHKHVLLDIQLNGDWSELQELQSMGISFSGVVYL